tara:strand:+ start:2515 stop:2658 length:144 start_codon:yes stop_codon:yes gene_type:complete
MPISLSNREEVNLASDLLEEAVVTRMIALINDLEQRVEQLESEAAKK